MSALSSKPARLADAVQPPVAAGGASEPSNAVQVRILTIVVIVLGVLLVVGLATVVGRIMYLSSQRAAGAPQSAVASQSITLDVPAGATVKHTSVAGDRLAITYETPQNTGIVVLNLSTGQVVSRVELRTAVPR